MFLSHHSNTFAFVIFIPYLFLIAKIAIYIMVELFALILTIGGICFLSLIQPL